MQAPHNGLKPKTARAPRGLLRLFAIAALGAAVSTPAFGQTEEGVKAAFLFNFARFTDWPPTAFANDNAPVTVAFLGAAAFADVFEQNITGKNAHGRDFVVKRIANAAEADGCQILYIGEGIKAAEALAALQGRPILTVGQSEDFLSAGGIVRFIRDGARIRFDLNLDAARSAALTLDTKLRQLARNIKGGA